MVFNEGLKIVIVFDQSAHSLCLLFALKCLEFDQNVLHKMFDVVVYDENDRAIELLLKRTGVFDINKVRFITLASNKSE